jgi:VWFA-related protein
MSSLLNNGTVLKEQYQVIDVFGHTEGTVAYLVLNLADQERLLLWESAELFTLRTRPAGVHEYFQEGDKHYLVLRLSGQSLAFMLTAAGRLEEGWAGLWVLQICRAVGYWHNREGEPLICLHQGRFTLSSFSLSDQDTVMIPSYGEFCRPTTQVLPTDIYEFSAPEDEEGLKPYSDVYALGAILYCLLVGQPPPEPQARLAREAKLVSPRKLNRDLSSNMEKVVLKALELDPRRRYPTAAEMAADLEAFLVQQLDQDKKTERKPSILARAIPFLVSLVLLACLVVVLEGRIKRPQINIPWLKGPPTPTFTPAPLVTPIDTPTPSPTWTPEITPTATPLPVLELVLNQVRLDQFPQVIAYTSALDDQQEPITGLSRTSFWVLQDGADVADFQLQNVDAAKDPLAMVVAMDISGSMQGEPLQKAKAAAANFVERFDPADQVSLVKFDDRIELVHDFSTDKGAIIQAIDSLKTRGDTALYDVIAYSVERLDTQRGRRAVIVLTDGRDTASTKYKLASAIAVANGANIPIFVVGLDSQQFTPRIMEQIASDTGGQYLFAPSPDDLDALYQKIRGQLQNQYRIEFTSLHEADDAEHTLGVGLDLGGGQEIWSEKSYRLP